MLAPEIANRLDLPWRDRRLARRIWLRPHRQSRYRIVGGGPRVPSWSGPNIGGGMRRLEAAS
jgi:hypothetical protein